MRGESGGNRMDRQLAQHLAFVDQLIHPLIDMVAFGFGLVGVVEVGGPLSSGLGQHAVANGRCCLVIENVFDHGKPVGHQLTARSIQRGCFRLLAHRQTVSLVGAIVTTGTVLAVEPTIRCYGLALLSTDQCMRH